MEERCTATATNRRVIDGFIPSFASRLLPFLSLPFVPFLLFVPRSLNALCSRSTSTCPTRAQPHTRGAARRLCSATMLQRYNAARLLRRGGGILISSHHRPRIVSHRVVSHRDVTCNVVSHHELRRIPASSCRARGWDLTISRRRGLCARARRSRLVRVRGWRSRRRVRGA